MTSILFATRDFQGLLVLEIVGRWPWRREL